ncbi:MAG: hypothetical protein AB7V46_06305 [Thermomicrobiales bacterium]
MRHTVLSLGVALAIAGLLIVAALNTGFALMLGAAAGIAMSVAFQRRAGQRSQRSLGGSDEPADIDAAYLAAQAAVREMPAQAVMIEDEQARQLAERTSELLSFIVGSIDNPEKKGVTPLLVDQLIEPAQALLTDYLWLQKRNESTARDAMTKIVLRDLPAAEYSARQVLALLERPGAVDVPAMRRAVDFQFSFGGEAAVATGELWSNRGALLEAAERQKSR